MNQTLPDPLIDLASGFTAKNDQQESQEPAQESQDGVETNPDPSREDSGADPSRSDAVPQLKEELLKSELLGSLTPEELLAHPTLGKNLQSWSDGRAAAQIRGTTQRIRNEERQKYDLEVKTQHFNNLSPDQLAEELVSSPEAAKAYAAVQAQPQPDPEMDAKVSGYLSMLRLNTTRMQDAGLDEATLASLNPDLHLRIAGDPDELLAKWISKIDDSIIASRVAKEVGKTTSTAAQAKELEQQAEEDEKNTNGAVLDSGRRGPTLPDVMEGSATDQLSLGFNQRRQQAARRR